MAAAFELEPEDEADVVAAAEVVVVAEDVEDVLEEDVEVEELEEDVLL
jgi:hypothetical protein